MSDDKRALENQEWLDVYRVVIKHWCELTIEELDRDQTSIPDVDLIEQLYRRAKWEKFVEVMLSLHRVSERYESDRGKLELVAWMFGDRLGLDGATIPLDVEKRIEWYKGRLGTQFERMVRAACSTAGVASPIEQLFVMEWHYQRIDERLKVKLRPQRRLATDSGEVRIDFVVERGANGLLPLAIEIDGHEFHEKTKEQAAHDRKRERSIVRAGYVVIRFTGHEVFRDTAACVSEVVELLGNPGA